MYVAFMRHVYVTYATTKIIECTFTAHNQDSELCSLLQGQLHVHGTTAT